MCICMVCMDISYFCCIFSCLNYTLQHIMLNWSRCQCRTYQDVALVGVMQCCCRSAVMQCNNVESHCYDGVSWITCSFELRSRIMGPAIMMQCSAACEQGRLSHVLNSCRHASLCTNAASCMMTAYGPRSGN